MSFLGEIKRRKVFQVAAVYAVVAWLIVQIVDVVNEPLNLPDWLDTVVIVLLAVGFPVAVILAWAFDLTPEGVVKDRGTNGRPQSSGRRIEYVLFGLMVVAVGWLVYRDIGRSEIPSEQNATIPPSVVESVDPEEVREVLPNSVAILPFANLSPDPDNAYFAAGIHESTINQLAKIHDLTVMARTSVMQYAENPLPIPDIAEALNVEMVMEGSVRYSEGRVLITTQLIDGLTGAQLWSNEFNRNLTDIFEIQAEVAQRIAASVEVSISFQERSRIGNRATESIEAYQHYIRALSMPVPAIYPEYLAAYIDSLERAIAADPNFAEAYAELAFGYFFLSDPDIVIEYAEKAIALNPTSGRAYWVIGMVKSNYHALQDEASLAFDKGIEYSPNNSDTLATIGYNLVDRGEYAKAFKITTRAIEVDPNVSYPYTRHGYVLMRMGKLEEAAGYLNKAITLDPSYYLPYIDLAIVEYLRGNRDESVRILGLTEQVMSSDAIHHTDNIGYLYGLLGLEDKVEEQLERLDKLFDAPVIEDWQRSGWIILGLRDRRRALRYWTKMVNDYLNGIEQNALILFKYKDPQSLIFRFKDNWLNDPMLEEPEFLELRRRLGYGR